MDRTENTARPARPMVNRKRRKVCVFCSERFLTLIKRIPTAYASSSARVARFCPAEFPVPAQSISAR